MAAVNEFDHLDDDTKAICAAWFGAMEANVGVLSFGMKDLRPSDRAQAALDKLVAFNVISKTANEDGSVNYTPLVDCSPLQQWFFPLSEEPRFKGPLVTKIHEEAEFGHTMTFSRSRS